MGGFAEPDRIRAGLSQTGCGGPGRLSEPEQNRNGGPRSTDKQRQMGKCTGNVLLSPRLTGLSKESVANVSQIVSLDKALLTERAGRLPRTQLGLVLSGIDIVLGR